jgi:hypothetical protein
VILNKHTRKRVTAFDLTQFGDSCGCEPPAIICGGTVHGGKLSCGQLDLSVRDL